MDDSQDYIEELIDMLDIAETEGDEGMI